VRLSTTQNEHIASDSKSKILTDYIVIVCRKG
jgi:hypothetical protein